MVENIPGAAGTVLNSGNHRRPGTGPLGDVHAFWLAGMSCDGCTISVSGAGEPSLEDLLLGRVPGLPRVVLHHPVLSDEAGEEFIHNRITLKASMGVWGCPSRWPDQWNRVRNLETVLELIEDGRLRFDGFVSLRIPFEEAERAYQTIREQPHHLKIVLTYDK